MSDGRRQSESLLQIPSDEVAGKVESSMGMVSSHDVNIKFIVLEAHAPIVAYSSHV